ncbi:hypothetical protein C8R44DRAFT_752977 [Mycena epipterygia]|nr:hypothetical protein C8R44DRAFT_752977 [Mycena epipterygia]
MQGSRVIASRNGRSLCLAGVKVSAREGHMSESNLQAASEGNGAEATSKFPGSVVRRDPSSRSDPVVERSTLKTGANSKLAAAINPASSAHAKQAVSCQPHPLSLLPSSLPFRRPSPTPAPRIDYQHPPAVGDAYASAVEELGQAQRALTPGIRHVVPPC